MNKVLPLFVFYRKLRFIYSLVLILSMLEKDSVYRFNLGFEKIMRYAQRQAVSGTQQVFYMARKGVFVVVPIGAEIPTRKDAIMVMKIPEWRATGIQVHTDGRIYQGKVRISESEYEDMVMVKANKHMTVWLKKESTEVHKNNLIQYIHNIYNGDGEKGINKENDIETVRT